MKCTTAEIYSMYQLLTRRTRAYVITDAQRQSTWYLRPHNHVTGVL
jgi:hypothetical protein